jgi:hypothetical protein
MKILIKIEKLIMKIKIKFLNLHVNIFVINFNSELV